MSYQINLTRLALAIAETKYSIDAVTRRAREELDGLEIEDPTRIFMHCFRMPDCKDYEFICLPDGHDGIRVDTVSYQESEVLKEGPFKGKKVHFPVADSAEDDDDDESTLAADDDDN